MKLTEILAAAALVTTFANSAQAAGDQLTRLLNNPAPTAQGISTATNLADTGLHRANLTSGTLIVTIAPATSDDDLINTVIGKRLAEEKLGAAHTFYAKKKGVHDPLAAKVKEILANIKAFQAIEGLTGAVATANLAAVAALNAELDVIHPDFNKAFFSMNKAEAAFKAAEAEAKLADAAFKNAVTEMSDAIYQYGAASAVTGLAIEAAEAEIKKATLVAELSAAQSELAALQAANKALVAEAVESCERNAAETPLKVCSEPAHAAAIAAAVVEVAQAAE